MSDLEIFNTHFSFVLLYLVSILFKPLEAKMQILYHRGIALHYHLVCAIYSVYWHKCNFIIKQQIASLLDPVMVAHKKLKNFKRVRIFMGFTSTQNCSSCPFPSVLDTCWVSNRI